MKFKPRTKGSCYRVLFLSAHLIEKGDIWVKNLNYKVTVYCYNYSNKKHVVSLAELQATNHE